MARISIEDCLNKIQNRFALMHLATQRAQQLAKGSRPLMRSKNKYIVTALREVAAQKVEFQTPLKEEEVEI